MNAKIGTGVLESTWVGIIETQMHRACVPALPLCGCLEQLTQKRKMPFTLWMVVAKY